MKAKFLLTAAMLTAALAVCAQPQTAAAEQPEGAPIAPFGDTLFFVYGRIGAVTPAQRAAIISGNISLLKDDPFFNADSLKISPSGTNHDIVYNGKTIVSITREQAQQSGAPQAQIAADCRNAIAAALQEEHRESRWLFVILRIAMGIGLIALTYLMVRYLNRLHRRARIFVRRHKKRTIHRIHHIFDANTQIYVALWILKLVRLLVALLLIYMCMLGMFRIIPATRWLSDTLWQYIIVPLKSFAIAIWEYIPNLIAIVIIIIIGRFFIKTIRILANRIGEGKVVIKGFYPEWAGATFNIARAILIIFMIIFIFPRLPHSQSETFKGISVFIGLLLSLGSTSIIGNLVAGLVITYMRPFHVGDCIRAGENFGNVVEKTALVTRIKTVKNEIVTIPNLVIMSTHTINYTSSAQTHGLVLHTKFTMGYSVPWRQVHELLIEAALKTPHTLREPRPFVLQTALNDFYVQYEINVYTNEADQIIPIYSKLNENIQDIFNREGIEMLMPPTYELRQADRPAKPTDYAKPAPPFRDAPQDINRQAAP